nr:MAG TPA: hypothetical protein [Caudoviricetes sp.]
MPACAIPSAYWAIHWLSLVLYIVPILCYAARSPLGRTSTTRHTPLLSLCYLLSFES